MVGAIRYHLRGLLNAHGRDGRAIFWRYFMFVVLLNVLIIALFAVPPLLKIIADVSATAKDLQTNTLEAEIIRDMAATKLAQTLVRVSIGLGVMNIILLTGSLIRRAHDTGLPGIVVGVPLAIQLVWMYFAYTQIAALATTMETAAATREAGQTAPIDAGMIAQDLLGWIVVLIVVLIGLAKSQAGANSYGEGPILP